MTADATEEALKAIGTTRDRLPANIIETAIRAVVGSLPLTNLATALAAVAATPNGRSLLEQLMIHVADTIDECVIKADQRLNSAQTQLLNLRKSIQEMVRHCTRAG